MPHVLIVDETERDRRRLMQGLRSAGFAVSVTGWGLTHDSIEALGPDAVLLGAGLGAVARLLTLLPPSVPLILLADAPDPAEREAALKAGCAGYSPHSKDADALAVQLRTLLKLTTGPGANKPKRPLLLSTPAAAMPGKRGGPRLLLRLVDEAQAQELAAALGRLGATVDVAADAEDAVRRAEQGTHDLAIVEATAGAGPGLIRRLRKRRSFQQLAILALVPAGPAEPLAAAFELGADEVARFPPALPELQRRLRVLTELRRSRALATRMQAAWRAAGDGAANLVALLDAQGRFTEVRGPCEALLGVPAKDLEGRRLRDWLHPYDRDSDSAGLLRSGRAMIRTVRLRRADGAHRWFQLRTEPLEDAARPDRSGVHLVARDVHAEVERRAGDEPPAPGAYDALPSRPRQAAKAPVLVLSGGSRPTRQRGRLLLVHGEASVRSLLQSTLQQQGFRVTLAAKASEALRLIDEAPPDAVLCGLEVPKLDRAQMELALRGPSAPVVSFSVYGFVEASEAVGPVGIDGLVQELVRALDDALS